MTSYWPKSRKKYLKQTDLRIWILGHVQHKHLALLMTENKEIHNRSALNLLCGKHRKHWHTHRPGTTHQAASVHTHCSWVLVAGCAVKHSAKVEVEVVTQGQAAEFTGVRAWQRRYSVSGSLWYYGKIGEAKRQRGRWLNSKNNQNMEKESKLNEQQQSPGI